MLTPLSRILALTGCLLFSLQIQAQQQDISFELVRLPGGTEENAISSIVQDSLGFMWYGSIGGLHRYDGYEVTTFTHDPKDSTSISNSYAECLYVDRSGILWVGTLGGGLNRFNAETETFTHVRLDYDDPNSVSQDSVITILEDNEGMLWVGTDNNGVYRLDPEKGVTTHFRHDPSDPFSLSNDRIRKIYQDRRGTLWIGTGNPWGSHTEGGLNRFEPATETFTRFVADPKNPASLIHNHVLALFEDNDGTFWVGTWGDGLHSMDRETGTFTRYAYDPKKPGKLSRPYRQPPVKDSGVTFLFEDHSGALWIGALQGGVNRYDPVSKTITSYGADSGAPGAIKNNFIWTIYQSHDGTLWIGTWKGLYKAGLNTQLFPFYTLTSPDTNDKNEARSFFEDRNGTLWIGTRYHGLGRYDREKGTVTYYEHRSPESESWSENEVSAIYEDLEGTFWVGSDEPAAGGIYHFDHTLQIFTYLRWARVSTFYEDRQGILWIGTYKNGLLRYDRKTETFIEYKHHNPSNSLSHNSVTSIHEDHTGTLWIGTWGGGLNRFDRTQETFTRYQHDPADPESLSGNHISSVYEDETGRLWVGMSLRGGLNLFDRTSGTFTYYDPRSLRLADDEIRCILGDQYGNLWIRSVQGLTRFNPDNNMVHTFGPESGLRVESFESGLNACYMSRGGELFFSETNGFTAFYPEQIQSEVNQQAPQVRLTGFRLFDESVQQDGESQRRTNLWNLRKITVPYDQNVFSFDFVGLHFSDPVKNQYAYMLENYDKSWREVGLQRTANYYRVPPGRYIFRVRTANADGIWNNEGAAIQLIILPPWWRTIWAFVLYGMIFVVAVITIDRFQRRRLIHRERLKSQIREADMLRAHERQLKTQNTLLEAQKKRLLELDALKSRFFANLSHEFRTPLTLLLGPIEDALRNRENLNRLPHHLPVMRRNAQRLLRLIDQLLDLSRLESGLMTLQARRTDLVVFVRLLVESFSVRAEAERIALQFASEVESCEIYADLDKLEKILSNLVSNAFKFTPQGGRIRIRLGKESDRHAVIDVRDTGYGIAQEELPHIFDRFYQVVATSTRKYGGVGIGLALTKELVELHAGTLEVESEPGFGTTFTIRFPLGIEHLPPGSIVEESEILSLEQPMNLADMEPVTVDSDFSSAEVQTDAPRVLLVEDNEELRAYMREQLSQSYQVVEASDGIEGLKAAQNLVPDLVIADVMMPEMDGFTLCRSIKEDENLGHVPVILLTARVAEESKLEGLETGADDYITKPFSMEELLVRVENLIELRRLLRHRYSGEIVLKPTDITVPSREIAFLTQLRSVVEQHLGESNLGVELIADEVGLSSRQLHRKIKEVIGLTPAGYVRFMRLERAAQLLEKHAGNVSEIAYQVGFQDVHYFSRLFRQTYGVSPSQYSNEQTSLSMDKEA